MPGYNFKWGRRVIPDPYDPKMVYITTFGGSVWHGPATGRREGGRGHRYPGGGLSASSDSSTYTFLRQVGSSQRSSLTS